MQRFGLKIIQLITIISLSFHPPSHAQAASSDRASLENDCRAQAKQAADAYVPASTEILDFDQDLALEPEFLDLGWRRVNYDYYWSVAGKTAYFGTMGVAVLSAFYFAPFLIASGGSMALLSLVNSGSRRAAPQHDFQHRSWKNALLGIGGIFVSPYMISGLFSTSSYSSYTSFLSGSSTMTEMWGLKAQLFGVRAKVESVDGLSEEQKRKALDILDSLEPNFDEKAITLKASWMDEKGKRQQFFDRLRRALLIANLPSETKKINYDEIRGKLDTLLDPQTPEVRKAFKELTKSVAASSQGKPIHPSKLFLLGAPGTGKTYLMQQYADLLGLPLIKVSLAEAKDVKELVGEGGYGGEQDKLSIFSKALMKVPNDKTFNNGIIFFDEADKTQGASDRYHAEAVTDFLLTSLLGDKNSLRLHDLGISIDTSKFIFVFAGNKPFKLDSLMSRLKLVKFDGFEFGERLALACRYFGSQSKANDIGFEDQDFAMLYDLTIVDHQENVGLRPFLQTLKDWVQAKVTSKHTQEPVEFDVLDTHKKNSRNIWDAGTAIALAKRKFDLIKGELPGAIVDKLENRSFPTAERAIHETDNNYAILKGLLASIEHIIHLPYRLKNLYGDEHLKRLGKEMNEGLFEYSSEIKDAIWNILDSHVANSVVKDPVRKKVLYFYGKPSTGKTYLANRLAESLGVALIHLKFEDDASTGRGQDASDSMASLSALTKSLLSPELKPYDKNAIIFIDEADKILNSEKGATFKQFLHELLDPDKASIRLGDLKVDLDVSHFLFILAGNDRIKKKDDSGNVLADDNSLESRMQLLEFKDFPRDRKIVLAQTLFDNLAKMHLPNCTDSCMTTVDQERDKIPDLVDERVILRRILDSVDSMVKRFEVRLKRNGFR